MDTPTTCSYRVNEIEIIESCLSSPEQCSGKPTWRLIRHRMQHVVTEDLLVVLVCFLRSGMPLVVIIFVEGISPKIFAGYPLVI